MVIIYTRKGEYLFPNLIIKDTENYNIGKYGLLRKTYLKEHKSGWYQSMLLTGKLDRHLAEIDMQATDRISLLVDQMKKAENVTEELKARDQHVWTQRMVNIINLAEEIVLAELIYA